MTSKDIEGWYAISLLPTSALRNLWLTLNVDDMDATKRLEESFTTTDVLRYGAMWALVAALVVIPLLASWRSTAQPVVDAAYPPNATTAADKGAQGIPESLESMLNLSSGILRNPLTLLTIAPRPGDCGTGRVRARARQVAEQTSPQKVCATGASPSPVMPWG